VDLVPEIDGLAEKRVATVERALGGLRQDLEELAEPLRAKLEAKKSNSGRGARSKKMASEPL
jgi:hypothetical protein